MRVASVRGPGSPEVAGAGERGIPITSADGRRVIDALHGLERSATAAGRGRESTWAADLRLAVEWLARALAVQHHHSSTSGARVPQLAAGDPGAERRVEELREQYRRIEKELHSLGDDLETIVAAGRIDVDDLRHRVERVVEELHYQRAREADLVYALTGSMPAPWTEPHTGRSTHLEALALDSRTRIRVMERELDRNRTAITVYGLERAAGAPAPGRIGQWSQDVAGALATLENAMALEHTNAGRAESLLTQLARSGPGVRAEITTLRVRYDHVREAVARLRGEVVHAGDDEPDAADVRRRVASILASLRHEQGRQADFVYERLA